MATFADANTWPIWAMIPTMDKCKGPNSSSARQPSSLSSDGTSTESGTTIDSSSSVLPKKKGLLSTDAGILVSGSSCEW